MNKVFKFGAIQFDIIKGEVETNMAAAMEYLWKLADQKADLAVLPELFSCGFDNEHIFDHAVNTQDVLDRLSGFARENSMAVAGTLPQAVGNKIFNTMYFIDRDGRIKGEYQKLHLFRLTMEHRFYTAGNRTITMDTSLGQVGLMICYDLRFPEQARSLFVDGARLLIVSAQWPSPRKEHWQTLTRARAIENQAYCVCANRTGKDEGLVFPGLSAIIDPGGQVLAEAGAAPGIITAKIDMDHVDQVRDIIPIMTDRRKDVYG